MVILAILAHSIQGHGISLHLFVSSLVSYITVLYFSESMSFISISRFPPKYFIIFGAIANDIVS